MLLIAGQGLFAEELRNEDKIVRDCSLTEVYAYLEEFYLIDPGRKGLQIRLKQMSIAQLIVTLCKFLELEHHNVLDHRIEPPCAILRVRFGREVYNGFPGIKSEKLVAFLEMTGNSSTWSIRLFEFYFLDEVEHVHAREIFSSALNSKRLITKRETKFNMKIFAKPATRTE